MPDYSAPLPWTLKDEEIEALRGFGAVEFTFVGDFPDRATAVRQLGDEYGWRGLDRSWWDEHLSSRRRRERTQPTEQESKTMEGNDNG